jgi:hypothetical protein
MHASWAKILDLSGAGRRVDKIIREGEDIGITGLAPDGTTSLDDFWASRGLAAFLE